MGHKDLCRFLLPAITATLCSVSATAQTSAFGPAPFTPNSETTDSFKLAPRFDVTNLPTGIFGADGGGSAVQGEQSEGVVKRSVKRTLDDQKEMYIAPFKPSNLRWDALVLAPTAVFLATDRHIEINLPGAITSSIRMLRTSRLEDSLRLSQEYGSTALRAIIPMRERQDFWNWRRWSTRS